MGIGGEDREGGGISPFLEVFQTFSGTAGENDDLIIGRVEAVDLQPMPFRFQAQ